MCRRPGWLPPPAMRRGMAVIQVLAGRQSLDIIDTLPPHMLATADMAELADDPKSKPA
jgi:hypothetical protein